MSALAGQLLITELNATEGLPRSARMVGKVLAQRLQRYPTGAFGGVASIAAGVEQRTGVILAERTVHYALMLLKREGFVRVQCCAGDACVGGRHHAARFVLGHRRLGKGWHRRGAFFLREKGAIGCRASRFVIRTSTPKRKEERLLARFPGRRGGAAPPGRHLVAAAAPERVVDGVGAERLSSIAGRLSSLFPPS
jgi:hypothetical protein